MLAVVSLCRLASLLVAIVVVGSCLSRCSHGKKRAQTLLILCHPVFQIMEQVGPHRLKLCLQLARPIVAIQRFSRSKSAEHVAESEKQLRVLVDEMMA